MTIVAVSAWTIAQDVHVSLGDADIDFVAGSFTATEEAEERALEMLASLDPPMAELVTYERVAPATPEPAPASDAPPEPPVSGSPPEPAQSDPGGASEPGADDGETDHSDSEASA